MVAKHIIVKPIHSLHRYESKNRQSVVIKRQNIGIP